MSGIKAGDRVRVRLYNSREGIFYGEPWIAEVLEVNEGHQEGDGSAPWYESSAMKHRPYKVSRPGYGDMWVKECEVRNKGIDQK